jgi:hypothetical protein
MKIIVFGALSVLSMIALVAFGSNDGIAPPREETSAAALVANFETVFYSESKVLVDHSEIKAIPDEDIVALQTPFADLKAALESAKKGASAEFLEAADAALVGAKDFRSPRGLGDVQSRFCYVLILTKGRSADLSTALNPTSTVSVLGKPVSSWVGSPTEGHPDSPHYYALQLSDSYVLVSNSLDDLGSTIQGLSSPKSDQRLTGALGGGLVRSKEYWGYRRYQHDNITDRAAAGMSDITNDAHALIYFVDVNKRVSLLRLLVSADDAQTATRLNARRVLPPLRQLNPQSWETTIPLAGDDATRERIMEVMGLFGFGEYL